MYLEIAIYNDYLEKYEEENAKYLISMEESWMRDYKSAAYIRWDCLNGAESGRDFTRRSAEFLHWDFDEVRGDNSLLARLLNGEFRENEALIVPPGKKAVPSYDEGIIKIEE